MKLRFLVPLLLVALLGTSCSATEADAPRPHVVAAFYPLEWASSQVLGGRGTVTTLTAPGVEAHDLELTPRQIASLAKADLVVYLSGFQPAVDRAIEQSGAPNVLDVATVVDLLPVDEHDEHDEGEEHTADDGHDHGTLDPHFWQDPQRMVALVNALAERLGEVDAPAAASYEAQAVAATAELQALDEEFTEGLSSCERSHFISTHASFGYLTRRYGLVEIGISGINPDEEPSPARIADVQAAAREHGLTTVFFETLTSDAVASAIAGDLGLTTAVLDPLEGVSERSPGDDYPTIMRANLQALRRANGCA